MMISKKYYVNLNFGLDPDTGRQVKQTKTFQELTEARATLRGHEADRDRGGVVIPRELTLEQWLKDWMENVIKLSQASTTVYAYQNMIDKHIIPALGKIPLQKLSPQQLLQLSEGTRLEVLMKLAGLLGLRREDIPGLTWDCVDCPEKKIEIREVHTSAGNQVVTKEPKTKTSQRTLYMIPEIEEVLRKVQEVQASYRQALGSTYKDGGYVFTHEDGRPVRPNFASDLFTKFIKDSSLPHLTLHGLGHSFASIANARGIPMFDIGDDDNTLLPFIFFPSTKPTPRFIQYLGTALPSAVLGIPVICCQTDADICARNHAIPKLIAIAGGTAVYMLLVQLLFK